MVKDLATHLDEFKDFKTRSITYSDFKNIDHAGSLEVFT